MVLFPFLVVPKFWLQSALLIALIANQNSEEILVLVATTFSSIS